MQNTEAMLVFYRGLGSPESLKAMLDWAGATVIEGPVGRQGGRKKSASRVYVPVNGS